MTMHKKLLTFKKWGIRKMLNIFLLIAEVVISLLLCLLFLVISIVGFFYTFIKHSLKWNYSLTKQFQPILRAFVLVNDCFANASGGEMLNDIIRVKEGEISYGWFQQTISSVTGLRFIFNKRDSRMRKILNKIHKDHCETAPSAMELFYYEHKYKTQ